MDGASFFLAFYQPQEQKKVDATSNSERTPAVPDDRQRRASDDDVIFQVGQQSLTVIVVHVHDTHA